MPELHPAVDRILNSGKYLLRPHVEGFTEHELKNAKGDVVRKVTKDDLEQFAKVNNQKAANGALTPIGPGHTYDDEYDKEGHLVRKFPEEDQPQPLGYAYNWRVEFNQHTGKYSLFHDEYIQSQIDGQNGLAYTSTFPRRSAEAYHNEHWIDWMALLRRAPRLDLALETYAKTTHEHIYYSHLPGGIDGPVIEMARGKMRYSMDTGGTMDPTTPPTAAPTPAPASGSSENPIDISSMPEHREAAEAYARHTSGMHHSRVAPLMKKMHDMYAAECGMQGDMNTPYAMGAPSPTSAGPAPAAPAAPAAPPTPHNPPVPEHAKMSQDQAAIEKERYERRLRDLEEGLATEKTARAAAEEKELKSYYERQILQLVYEGYEGINAEEELKTVEGRKYSRQQFDDYMQTLRRLPKAPISPTRIDPHSHELQRPIGKVETQSDKYNKNFDKIQRYVRQGMSNHEAYEKATGEKWQGSNGVLSK